MSRFIASSLAVFVFILVWAAEATGVELASVRTAAAMITTEHLKSHVDVLADDAFEGRAAGSRGGYAAAGYLVKELQSRSVRPAGENGSYFQSFGRGYRNILALLEGSDPELKREVVIVSAHYDHVGYGSQNNSFGPWGYIHNGADDNASGLSGLLETLDALRAIQPPPRRSALFAFFDGEELGLLGSKQWAAYPTLPKDRIVAVVNVDMIGRMQNDRVELYGTRSARGLRRMVSECNELTNLKLDFTWEMKENSDHYSFYVQHIPVMMLHTGLHSDYHRPSDDVQRLNMAGMQQATRLLLALTYDLTTRPTLSPFRRESLGEQAGNREGWEQVLPDSPPRLGIVWTKPDPSQAGLLVQNVTNGSAAQRAGIRVGDRMMQFAGEALTDDARFRLNILAARSPVLLKVQRTGEPEPVELKVNLSGSATRIGLSWKEDDAEPGTVFLTQVVPGSAAAQAGLAPRDRLYAVGRQPFPNSVELHRLLTTLPSPIEVLVERDGRLRRVTLNALPPLEP